MRTNDDMCDFDGNLKDLGSVPGALLAPIDTRLAESRHLWLAEDQGKPNRFSAFAGSTLHIVFQFPTDLRSHLRSDRSPLWAAWRDAIEPLIAHATIGYGYANGQTARVMLAR